MTYILCIETSTTVCSVALYNEYGLLSHREENNGYTHAENLHEFIQQVLDNGHVTPNQLSAIAVGKGPGSYTGLRIGVSAAKGLCYALNIPLIAVNSLYSMAYAVKKTLAKSTLLCPMLDARRMEVYTAMYESNTLEERQATHALIVTNEALNNFFDSNQHYTFFGNGMNKCRTLLESLPHADFIEDIVPSATNMMESSFQAFYDKNFEDVAYFEPFYLKEFFSGTK